VARTIALCNGSGFFVSFATAQGRQATQSRQHFGEKHSAALARIEIVGKQIGWHSFRHSLATKLRSLGVDIKVAQELMRHSSSRTTLDRQKREGSLKVTELMLPLEVEKTSAPFRTLGEAARKMAMPQTYVKKGFNGGPDRDRTDDLFHAIMPKAKLLTAKQL
jgi:hypothetical protein